MAKNQSFKVYAFHLNRYLQVKRVLYTLIYSKAPLSRICDTYIILVLTQVVNTNSYFP
jgi:hypothetical protein